MGTILSCVAFSVFGFLASYEDRQITIARLVYTALFIVFLFLLIKTSINKTHKIISISLVVMLFIIIILTRIHQTAMWEAHH